MKFKFLSQFFGFSEPEKEEEDKQEEIVDPAKEEEDPEPEDNGESVAELQEKLAAAENEKSQAKSEAAEYKQKYEAAQQELAAFGGTSEERASFLSEAKRLTEWYHNSQKLGVLGAGKDANAEQPKERYESAVTKEGKAIQAKIKERKAKK